MVVVFVLSFEIFCLFLFFEFVLASLYYIFYENRKAQ